MKISALRREYSRMSLSKQEIDPDPFRQFHIWLNQAIEVRVEDATAMSFSTVGSSGMPSSRIVLLKELDDQGFVFFTSYESRKGEELLVSNKVALLFYWKELERQVRISGVAGKISRHESASYFNTRPLESKLSAVISPQSQPVPDRKWLESKWEEAKLKYELKQPEIPDTWGGYRVKPIGFEFFQGREYRLHDRIRYQRQNKGWTVDRLAP